MLYIYIHEYKGVYTLDSLYYSLICVCVCVFLCAHTWWWWWWYSRHSRIYHHLMHLMCNVLPFNWPAFELRVCGWHINMLRCSMIDETRLCGKSNTTRRALFYRRVARRASRRCTCWYMARCCAAVRCDCAVCGSFVVVFAVESEGLVDVCLVFHSVVSKRISTVTNGRPQNATWSAWRYIRECLYGCLLYIATVCVLLCVMITLC